MDAIDPLNGKLGVSRSLLRPVPTWEWPLHGLRHPPEGETSGWYWWTGDLSDDSDFFVPLHAHHLIERWPQVLKYLLLPPGSRALMAPHHAETWFDVTLLGT